MTGPTRAAAAGGPHRRARIVARSVWPPEPVRVDELQERLRTDGEYRAGFEWLTPGRKREYNPYFSGANQAATRAARAEKYADRIASGQGFRDRPTR